LQPAIKFSRCILFKADFSWWQMRPSLFNRSGTATAVRVLQISKRLRQHPSLGYAMAFVAVGLATLIQWLGQDQYGNAPFLTIYPAVILTTLVGGLGAGFLSALLAGLSQWGLFIPTLRWLAVASYTFDAIVCVLLIVFIDRTLDLLLINIDQEKQAKQHQYLLATELHHRIQNLFTVIQAIIRFSLPGDGLIQQSVIKQRLMDRLQSMSATNRVITNSMGDGVRLIDLIKSGIHGFETQFEISGAPGLVLGPQMTQNFSLILHELLTNALKHGALSVPAGRVSLRLDWNSWVLTFMWQESGGPAVSPPAGAGFGSRILGDFARSFSECRCQLCPDWVRYTLQIHSDQNRFAEPRLATTTAVDSTAAAAAKAGEAHLSRASGFDHEAAAKQQTEVVLHDWELYQAGKEKR
jgi:two-component sensor histidine kinase